MAQKYQAKNVIFKAKNVNAGVNKDSVIKEVVAEANRFVSDPANTVDGSKHTFSFQQEEEIPVAIYAPDELIDSNSCELRIRQGHKGKVSYVTKFSNVKNPLTTKTVLVSWIFDSNSQYKSVLVINAQPARETTLELFYSEFTPNRIVKDESGKETMPYLGWEKDQVLAWFKDRSKLRGCVLALTEDEYVKSSEWIRGDKFFKIPLPEKEEKKNEWKEPNIAPFVAYEDITDDISNLIQYLYEYEIDKNEQAPFLLNRNKREIESVLSVKADPDNLDDILDTYIEDDEDDPNPRITKSIEVIKSNKEAFLDLVNNVDQIVTKTVETAYNDPHCWGEPFDDPDEEEAFQEDGPELDFETEFDNWKSSDEGQKYSQKYQSLVKTIIKGFSENEYFSESWLDWIEG